MASIMATPRANFREFHTGEVHPESAHSPGPISPRAAVRGGTLDGYYGEAREVRIIPEGSRSEPRALIGVGPGLCGLLRMHLLLLGTLVNNAYGPMPKRALTSGMSSSFQVTP